MTLDKLVELLSEDSAEKAFVRDSCRLLYGKEADAYAESFLSSFNSPLDAFSDSCRNVDMHGEYKLLKLMTFFKLLHMGESYVSHNACRSLKRKRIKVSSLKELVLRAFSDFDMQSFEKMLLFTLSKGGYLTCVYESKSTSGVSCSIAMEEFYTIARKHNGKSFVLIHSHPFGDVTPSETDRYFHSGIKKILSFTESTLLEHVIVSQKDGDPVFGCIEKCAEYYDSLSLSDILK